MWISTTGGRNPLILTRSCFVLSYAVVCDSLSGSSLAMVQTEWEKFERLGPSPPACITGFHSVSSRRRKGSYHFFASGLVSGIVVKP
ncbi:hypothetical protein EDB87DRAFT_1629869 [Lactarius vividus]|nr:hypothetical protein EDB87DRAFT_1629869 [Lactarius vividus]